jgi:protein TonB
MMATWRHLSALPLAFLTTLAMLWLMSSLITRQPLSTPLIQPAARIVLVGNDLQERDNPDEDKSPEPPELPEPPEPAEPPELTEPAEQPPTLPPQIQTADEPQIASIAEPVTTPKPVTEQRPAAEAEKPKKRPVRARKRRKPVASPAKATINSHPVYRPKPRYPRGARRKGQEGWVLVRYGVARSGQVTNPRVIASSPKGVFDKAALQAVRRWRYKPQQSSRSSIKSRIRFVLR